MIRKKSSPVILSCLLVAAFTGNLAQAKPWNELDSIEQDILKAHKADWPDYNEQRQVMLLRSVSKEANRKRNFRKWLKKHPLSLQKTILKNMKRMSDAEFKKYFDSLKKKYGEF